MTKIINNNRGIALLLVISVTTILSMDPLKNISEFKVNKVRDFSQEGYVDEDDEQLPLQNFIQLSLENGFTVAIRPSGTEPKIKYYLFGCHPPKSNDLEESKKMVSEKIKQISEWLVEDAYQRVGK